MIEQEYFCLVTPCTAKHYFVGSASFMLCLFPVCLVSSSCHLNLDASFLKSVSRYASTYKLMDRFTSGDNPSKVQVEGPDPFFWVSLLMGRVIPVFCQLRIGHGVILFRQPSLMTG